VDAVTNPFTGYAQEHRPLTAYAVLVGIFNAAFAGFLLAVKWSGRDLPERMRLGDLLLLGVATHKLSRLLAKDTVTSFLRAPFTTFEGPAGASEVNEQPRGMSMRLALGELLSCPFCVGQWVAAGFIYGLVFAPRVTRLVASIFAILTLSDFLHYAYEAAQQRAQQTQQDAAEENQ
jgi:hypothetical protein